MLIGDTVYSHFRLIFLREEKVLGSTTQEAALGMTLLSSASAKSTFKRTLNQDAESSARIAEEKYMQSEITHKCHTEKEFTSSKLD